MLTPDFFMVFNPGRFKVETSLFKVEPSLTYQIGFNLFYCLTFIIIYYEVLQVNSLFKFTLIF